MEQILLIGFTCLIFIHLNECKFLYLSQPDEMKTTETMSYYDNYTDYDDYEDTYFIRYLKIININVDVNFDLKISIPLPNDDGFEGSIDIDIPIEISIRNKTLLKFPYPNKPIRVPLYYPVIKLPNLFNYETDNKDNYYYDPQAPQMDYDTTMHYMSKRSLSAQSAQHRRQIFSSIESALNR